LRTSVTARNLQHEVFAMGDNRIEPPTVDP
jgi:hypothetical protein